MKTALTIVFMIISIVIILIVLAQESKDNGLGSLAGSSSASETYWSKNKGRSKESYLILATTIAVIIFLGLAILLSSKVMN